jgi:hypothetical protein
MKTRTTVVFAAADRSWPGLRAAFERCGLAELVAAGRSPIDVYTVTLDEGSAELDWLYEELAALDLDWGVTRQNVYDTEELRAAPLLRLVVRRAPNGVGGPEQGTEYDMSAACPRCGSGARQVSALHVRELPKRGPIFETLDGDYLVSERLRAAMLAIRPAGLELREAVEASTGDATGFFQLLAAPLPAMDGATEGVLREDPCGTCNRDGHFSSPEQPERIVYRRTQLPNTVLDAHSTYELFGNSRLRSPFRESVFAQPLLLISTRLYEVFVEQRVPNVVFEPVTTV